MARDATNHIRVTDDTWKQLNNRKEPGDSFNDVIQRLLNSQTDDEGNGSCRTVMAD
ncbi:antitoxin VapB family protein [Halobacterium sp. BOL4-2]|uniref:antitoxin VapB family protein n=1 Tax=Halobacterium sp. BOL4-2 TaxID=2810537 RepID=UPI001962867A|nr:antitoxin VapB family protein [Halobacterium sp. BOL4-2]QRY26389.1 antitoxin VapB family protein [Halobacterium sp. BOL4-2]